MLLLVTPLPSAVGVFVDEVLRWLGLLSLLDIRGESELGVLGRRGSKGLPGFKLGRRWRFFGPLPLVKTSEGWPTPGQASVAAFAAAGGRVRMVGANLSRDERASFGAGLSVVLKNPPEPFFSGLGVLEDFLAAEGREEVDNFEAYP